ncbi:MAG: methyltransferase domain-containing protein [Phycisphaerales bacterium]|nr:methyltransferase domain-containing protein [Phycisphaerales bacterium]MCB9854432.1 methyltransferase domain-containing protein [Phycisphaerales bacterium]
MSIVAHGKQRAADWDAFSANYHAESVTPFSDGVRFRLRSDLRRLMRQWQADDRRSDHVFVDFGCGPGDALELVAGKVPLSVGIDFSPKMLSLAAERLRRRGVPSERLNSKQGLDRICADDRRGRAVNEAPQTLLVQADLRKLRRIRGCVDAATSINSICASNTCDASQMFREMARSIRPGGVFFIVWPALESLEYLFELDRRAGRPPEERNEILGSDGVNVDASGYALKLFRADEIRALCGDVSMVVETIEKLSYPWTYMNELGWGYYPGRPRLWDWYVIAQMA